MLIINNEKVENDNAFVKNTINWEPIYQTIENNKEKENKEEKEVEK